MCLRIEVRSRVINILVQILSVASGDDANVTRGNYEELEHLGMRGFWRI